MHMTSLMTLPSDEAIVEDMNGFDMPWDDMHHHSYFLPDLSRIEQDDFRSTLSEIVGHIIVPFYTHMTFMTKETWRVSLLPSQSISLVFLARLKMYTSVQIVLQKKL
jgi:hypothetical protein